LTNSLPPQQWSITSRAIVLILARGNGMRKGQLLAVSASLALTSVSLGGCAELEQQAPILALLDRGPQPPNISLRQERLPDVPRYRPVKSCSYNAGYGAQNSPQSFTIQPVRNRLLVTSDNKVGGRSTAIISNLGYRYSFNVFDPRTGSQISSDRWTGQMASQGVSLKNNMDLFVPEYIPGPKDYGQIVSLIKDATGKVATAYLYGGVGQYQGRDVILLRIVVNPTNAKDDINRSVGYSLVDARRALPIKLSAFRGPNIRLDSTGCVD
jgi:hypothetical protein